LPLTMYETPGVGGIARRRPTQPHIA